MLTKDDLLILNTLHVVGFENKEVNVYNYNTFNSAYTDGILHVKDFSQKMLNANDYLHIGYEEGE